MAEKALQNARRSWLVTRLKKHPRQDEFFGDLGRTESNALPLFAPDGDIVIVPDGTVVGGVRVFEAAKRAGLASVLVRVREDLDEGGAVINLAADDMEKAPRHFQYARMLACYDALEARIRAGGEHFQKKDVVRAVMRALHVKSHAVYAATRARKAPALVREALLRGEVSMWKVDNLVAQGADVQAAAVAKIRAGTPPAQAVTDAMAEGAAGTIGVVEDEAQDEEARLREAVAVLREAAARGKISKEDAARIVAGFAVSRVRCVAVIVGADDRSPRLVGGLTYVTRSAATGDEIARRFAARNGGEVVAVFVEGVTGGAPEGLYDLIGCGTPLTEEDEEAYDNEAEASEESDDA